MRSIADPPPRSAFARFEPDFAPRFLLTVDILAGPDEIAPLSAVVDGLARFQQFCEGEAVAPVYLVDGPVARSARTAEILREPLAAQRAEIGVFVHGQITRPFDREQPPSDAIRGLRDDIQGNFGVAPTIGRALLAGFGPDLPDLLADSGIVVDSSVRARFDLTPLGGTDFRRHPPGPYWLDDERRLLELPPTTVFWGPLRKQGPWLYPAMGRTPRLRRLVSRIGLLERIALAPERIGVDEAIRGIDMALDDGLPLLVLSCGISALCPDQAPRGRAGDELEEFYDWWCRVFAYLELRKVLPTTISGVMHAVRR